MSHALTIARRELAAMFRAPLAYVFLVLFVVVSQLPHVLVVFQQGQAELRLFFDFMPWCIVVFAALVTMRSWAEERQDNTYEMLLTFPMKDGSLVLGKWLAAFGFMAFGIVCTFWVPVMMFSIGNPDTGPVVSGYLGALLLAASVSAMGIFFSGLTRSQLVAALLSLVAGFMSLLVGTEAVSTLLDAKLGGVGTGFRTMIGTWSHYAVFSRGVVEVLDVVFFAVWTVVFLHLNSLFLSLRRIPDSWPTMTIAALLGVGSGMLASRLVSEGSALRIDLTEDRLYTLSPGTLAIFSKAEVPVQVKFYVSSADDMPSQYKSLEREVVDRLNELQVASHGKLVFGVQHFKADNLILTDEEAAAGEDENGEEIKLGGDDDKTAEGGKDGEKPSEEKKKADEARKRAKEKEKSPERIAYAKGVRPFTVESYEAAQTSSKVIYATIGVAYREKDEQLITPVIPQKLAELEYLLTNTVAKLVRSRPPKIALYTGEEPMDPQMRMMMQRMGREIPDPYASIEKILRQEKYDVQKTKLTAQSPMPDDYDALLVVGPAGLDDRQKWEISRAITNGRPALIALQRFSWDYRQQGRGLVITPQEADPGLDEILEPNGVTLNPMVLMDMNKRALSVPTGGIFPMSVDVPMHVWVTRDSMSKESALTQRLSSILYLWGSALDLDDAKVSANDLKPTKLLSSSEKAWLLPAPARGLRAQDVEPAGKELKPRLLAVELSGKFKDPYGKKSRPAWSPKMELDPTGRPLPAAPDKPEEPPRPAPGKLIVIGCARMWSDPFMGSPQLGNTMLLLNCVDGLTLDENLLQVRSKQPTDRAFDKPSNTAAMVWTAVTLVVWPLAIVGVGIFVAVLRMRRRESWGAAHGRWRS